MSYHHLPMYKATLPPFLSALFMFWKAAVTSLRAFSSACSQSPPRPNTCLRREVTHPLSAPTVSSGMLTWRKKAKSDWPDEQPQTPTLTAIPPFTAVTANSPPEPQPSQILPSTKMGTTQNHWASGTQQAPGDPKMLARAHWSKPSKIPQPIFPVCLTDLGFHQRHQGTGKQQLPPSHTECDLCSSDE